MDFEINKPLTVEEEAEAKRLAEIARRAEEKASLMSKRDNNITHGHEVLSVTKANGHSNTISSSSTASETNPTQTVQSAKFLTKQERERLALERLELKRNEQEQKEKEMEAAHNRFITGKSNKL